MKRLLSFCLALLFVATTSAQQIATIPFYSESIEIQRLEQPIHWTKKEYSYSNIKHTIAAIRTADHTKYLETLSAARKEWKLSDPLFYLLITKTSKEYCEFPDESSQKIFNWYILQRFRYDSRLYYNDQDVCLTVKTEADTMISLYRYTTETGVYAVMSNKDFGSATAYPINIGKRPFAFLPNRLPAFPNSQYEDRAITFEFEGTEYKLEYQVNKEVSESLADQHYLTGREYFRIPTDDLTTSQIRRFILKSTKGMSPDQKIRFVLTMVRKGFSYCYDEDCYGKEQYALSAQQMFYYQRGDCEDKAALFFELIQNTFDIPMVVVNYPDHISIAMRWKKLEGRSPIKYNGKDYYIADPAGPGPGEQYGVGYIPKEVKDQPYKVIYSSDTE